MIQCSAYTVESLCLPGIYIPKRDPGNKHLINYLITVLIGAKKKQVC